MNRKPILLISLFGFALRAVYLLFFDQAVLFPDEERFVEEARSLLAGTGLKVAGLDPSDGKIAHDMPLTGLVIAGLFALLSNSILTVKMVFAFIGSVTIFFVAKLAYQLNEDDHDAVIAAVLMTFMPTQVLFSTLLMSECLYTLSLVLVLLILTKQSGGSPVAVGILSALSHLVRSSALYLLPCLWALRSLVWGRQIKDIALIGIVFFLILTPWGIRNLVHFGEFHISTTSSGLALLEGNNKWNLDGGVSGRFSDERAFVEGFPDDVNELQLDRLMATRALTFIRENPSDFAHLALKRVKRFWSPIPNSPDFQGLHYKLMMGLATIPIFILCLISPVLLQRQIRRLSFLYSTIAYFTLIHAVSIGSVRYRIPIEPLLIVIASLSLGAIYKKMNHRSQSG